MGVILDDLWDHEGYGARRPADGTNTRMWSVATKAYVASCGCGWEGGAHPPTEDGYESAVEEWEADHARPLLARTVPEEIRSLIRDTERSVSALVNERPLAALAALRSLAAWASTTVARLQILPATTTPRTTTEGPGRELPGPSLGL